MISEGLIRLSIREECRDVNFPKLTFSVLRKLVFTGIKYNNIIILIDHLYSIGLLLFFFIADFLIIHSAILLFLFDQTPNCFSFCCPPISKPLLRRTCNWQLHYTVCLCVRYDERMVHTLIHVSFTMWVEGLIDHLQQFMGLWISLWKIALRMHTQELHWTTLMQEKC